MSAACCNACSDHFDDVYFTRYSTSSRAVPPLELQQVAEELTGRRWPAFEEPAAAWEAARHAARGEDLICITGSFFLAAEMKLIIREENAKPEIRNLRSEI